ncbi:hypothetical protein SprV_0200811000 [Sparganum proliferum]
MERLNQPPILRPQWREYRISRGTSNGLPFQLVYPQVEKWDCRVLPAISGRLPVVRTLTHPDQRLLPPPDVREGHLDASLVTSLVPAGLCPRPEARLAGRAGDKGDLVCRWVDRPSPRHLADVDSLTASQETSSNELAQRLDNLPVADAAVAAADENVSVEIR